MSASLRDAAVSPMERVSDFKLIYDSDVCLIYETETEIPSPPDKTLICKCRYEYREMKCGNHPVTKQELMAELKKRRVKSNVLTILSRESFTKEAIIYRTRYHPRIRLIAGDLDSVRRANR